MNLDFASVWEMISDIVPENDALISGDEVISWRDYDLQSSKIATALTILDYQLIQKLVSILIIQMNI